MRFNHSNKFVLLACTAALINFAMPLYGKTKKAPASDAATEVPSSETPTFRISEGISDKIYQQAANKTATTNAPLQIESSIRIFMPSRFELQNKYFTVPYSENSDSITGFSIGGRTPVTGLADYNVASFATLGYAYSQGIYEVISESGLEAQDEVELRWIPLQAGLEASSQPVTSQRIIIGAISSAGVDWYTQSGRLDGMNQTFWVPRSEIGASITFFSNPAAGFNGLKLSTLYYSSMASQQTNRGLAIDLGARYAF